MIGFFRTNTENFEKCYEIEDFFSNYDINEVFINMEEVDYNSISTILPSDEEICCAITMYGTFNSNFFDSNQIFPMMEENETDAKELFSSPLKIAIARKNGFGEREIRESLWRLHKKMPGFIRRYSYKKYGLTEEIVHDMFMNLDLSQININQSYNKVANSFYNFMIKSSVFICKIWFKTLYALGKNTPFNIECYLKEYRYCKSFTQHNIELYNDLMTFLNGSSIFEYCFAYQTRMNTMHNAEHEDIKEILYNFMFYSMCYDESWKDVLWGDFLTKASKNKGFNLKFIKKLNKFAKNDQNRYVRIFCDRFKEYDPDSKLLDISRINWQDKILVRDTDESHQKWFVKGTRLDEIDERRLYQGLEKIWKTLADEGYIDEKAHNKELFIYRLSGINCPIDEKNKDKTLSFRGNDTLLGALVRCLYEDKVKHYTPPYKDIAWYFNKGDKNLGTVGDKDAKNPSMARAINIVKNSGFSTKEDLEERLRLSID